MDYFQKTFAAPTAIAYTAETLRESVRKIDWLNYTVDPEWARFCKFGPEDIGGPFEKLGIIRRIDRIHSIAMSAAMAKTINEQCERQILGTSRPDFGLNIITVPGIPENTAYLFSKPKPITPFNLIRFDDV